MQGEIKNKTLRILEKISEDMRNDAKEFDGKPFNGKTVAQYFAYQGAAIHALTNILRQVINEGDENGK